MSYPRIALLLLGTLAGLTPAALSQIYHRHNITVFGGAAQPKGDLDNFFSTSFLTGVEYGFRFHQNFQADVGFDAVFGAAGVNDWLPTAYGNLRIHDYQSFIPFGGRVILPLRRELIHIYGGMGGAYMRYAERIRQPFQGGTYQIPCYVCAARDGFGYYGLFGVDAALDQARHFRLGGAARVYRGHTSGDALGAAPPFETTDRWVNLMATFTVTF